MTINQTESKGPAIVMWIIAGLYLSLITGSVIYFFSLYAKNNPDYPTNYFKVLVLPVAWTILLVTEGLLFWKMRKKMNKQQAWIHTICMFMAFLVTYLFTLVANIYITQLRNATDTMKEYEVIYKINKYSFWAFFIIGHIFFIAVVVQGFSKNQKNNTDAPSSGILDEFAD